jgi:hypothetical protein
VSVAVGPGRPSLRSKCRVDKASVPNFVAVICVSLLCSPHEHSDMRVPADADLPSAAARAIVLTNQKGAVLQLSGHQVGLMANADLSGLAITLK